VQANAHSSIDAQDLGKRVWTALELDASHLQGRHAGSQGQMLCCVQHGGVHKILEGVPTVGKIHLIITVQKMKQ
jgi:hypothetical protein